MPEPLADRVKALCDEAEYVVLAVDDPGTPPVRAVAVSDLLALLPVGDAGKVRALLNEWLGRPDYWVADVALMDVARQLQMALDDESNDEALFHAPLTAAPVGDAQTRPEEGR